MNPARVPLETPLRIVAAAVAVVSMALLYALPVAADKVVHSATVICLVFAAGAAFVLVCRNLGTSIAAGLGIVMALALSIGLARFTGHATISLAAFMLISTVLFLAIGRLAGAVEQSDAVTADRISHLLERSRSSFMQSPGSAVWLPATEQNATTSIETTLGGLISDFQAWTGTEAANPDRDAPWQAFARFIRQALRERLGARGVRVYAFDDQERALQPLAVGRGVDEAPPDPAVGVMGYAVQTGQVFVRSSQPASVKRKAAVAQRWSWLLPLREAGHTRVIVAIGELERGELNRPSVAYAVRDLLQLCWAHVCGRRALAHAEQHDVQTGLLNRRELLDALRRSGGGPAHRGEPLSVLVVGLEGLRRLDDQGHYAARDGLLQEMGRTLRLHLHSDDFIGRFNDDRFLIVMRRSDARLGQTVAKLVLDDVRREVVAKTDPLATLSVNVRGALVVGESGEDGEALISRALAQLDHARQTGRQLSVAETVENTIET